MSNFSKDLCIPIHAPLNKQNTEFQTYMWRQSNPSELFQKSSLEDVKGFCVFCNLDVIKKQDYILTPGRYVDIEKQKDDGEPFEEKISRLTSELSSMFERSHELEDEIRKKLGAIWYEI